MGEGMSLAKLLARILICSLSSVVSLAVLLLAIVWGWHETSALRQGQGFDVPESLHGYNVIITGSTSGIGFETALEFYKRRAHVLVHSSDKNRAFKSAEDIKSFGGNTGGRATPVGFDLSKFDEIRAFAQRVGQAMPRVDILVLNACRMYGLAPLYNDQTLMKQPAKAFKAESGHDSVQAINHLGHFLLTELLLPVLAHGATIVVMSAMGGWDSSHTRIMPPWGYLGKHEIYPKTANEKRIFWELPGMKKHAYYAYHDSKYMNMCHARWLRRRLARNATVIIHDPGYVVTTPMQSRDSPIYKQRISRTFRQTKFYLWHAPVEDGGRHLLQTAFVTRRPVPDLVASYFLPRQVVSWFAPYAWERKRPYYVSQFQNVQKLLWGLHASVGPECDEDLQDAFAAWSAKQVGLSL